MLPIALVTGFWLTSSLVFAETGEERGSYIPSIHFEETAKNTVLYISNPTLNQCQFIDKPCLGKGNQSLTIGLKHLSNQPNDMADNQRQTNFKANESFQQKAAILPEYFADPLSDATFLVFSLNHLQGKSQSSSENVFFINKIGLEQCQLIDSPCGSRKDNSPSQNEVFAAEKGLIPLKRETLAPQLMDDIFSQKTALLPTNLDAPGGMTSLLTSNELTKNPSAESGLVIIPKITLNQCQKISQNCPFIKKEPAIAPLNRYLVSNQTALLIDNQRLDAFTEAAYQQKTVLLPSAIPAIETVDAGFIINSTPTGTAETFVGNFTVENTQNPIINFDGDGLIYLDAQAVLTHLNGHSGNSRKSIKKSRLTFAKDKKILLDKTAKNAILVNVINTKGHAEANHISVRNNTIILDNKPVQIHKVAENTYYLNKTRNMLQTSATEYTREELLHMRWEPRKLFGF
ncbi:MAG: hypothetical protein WC785_09875 [Tatlockia sp.]|jgi:hypothetical protein